jgi:tripeptidyl-peptidase-1
MPLACKSYDLPAHVAAHVDLVMPTVHFDTIVPRALEPPPFVNRYERATRGLGIPGAGFRGPSMTAAAVPILKNQLEHCDEQITPECLKALYGIDYTPVATQINTIGVCKCLLNKRRCQVLTNLYTVEATPQAFIASDIDKFAKYYAPDIHGKRPMVVSIDGGQFGLYCLTTSCLLTHSRRLRPNFPTEPQLHRRI